MIHIPATIKCLLSGVWLTPSNPRLNLSPIPCNNTARHLVDKQTTSWSCFVCSATDQVSSNTCLQASSVIYPKKRHITPKTSPRLETKTVHRETRPRLLRSYPLISISLIHTLLCLQCETRHTLPPLTSFWWQWWKLGASFSGVLRCGNVAENCHPTQERYCFDKTFGAKVDGATSYVVIYS